MHTDELFIDEDKLPKPLLKEDCYDLIDRMKKGDASSRDKLVEHNIRLVLYEVANKFKFVDYDKKDLVSIGNVGLIKAIDTFDTSKKVEFATYAIKCIDNEILMFLRKIKGHQKVDSLDRVINCDKDGNELSLEDILSDDIDIVEECIDNEIYQIICKAVNTLPERDKDIIIMYYGLFGNKRYTQTEIAGKFKISRSYVSILRRKIVKRLSDKLEVEGVIELNRDDKNRPLKQKKEGEKEMPRRLQTIYEYFKQYSKEQINEILSKLTEEERTLITLRYGADLEHPHVSENWNEENRNDFYGLLVPKMKRLLAKLNNENVQKGKKLKPQEKTPIRKKTVNPVVKEQNEPATINSSYDDMTREDYLKILELLKTPSFRQMMNEYSPKEAMIVSLKLGHIDGKYFSTESIANFFSIDSKEVIDTTRTILLAYKERLNQMFDRAIQISTDESASTDKDHNKSFYK